MFFHVGPRAVLRVLRGPDVTSSQPGSSLNLGTCSLRVKVVRKSNVLRVLVLVLRSSGKSAYRGFYWLSCLGWVAFPCNCG